jgi:hypothetical protein
MTGSTIARSFFILTVVYSLIAMGILNSTGIDAFAKKIQRNLLIEQITVVVVVEIKAVIPPVIQTNKWMSQICYHQLKLLQIANL